MERLYIDGVLMDLSGEVGITLSMRSNLFESVDKISGNTTYTVKLPRTAHNSLVLGWADRMDSLSRAAMKSHKARYFRDGVELVRNGIVSVLSASDEGYEVSMMWGCRPKFDMLVSSGATLRDLTSDACVSFQAENRPDSFGTFDNRGYGYMRMDVAWVPKSAGTEWRSANYFGWWQNPAYSVEMRKYYEQGNAGSNGNISFVSYENNHPSATVKWLLWLIKQDYGVEFRWTGEAKALIDALAIPCIQKEATQLTYGTAGLMGTALLMPGGYGGGWMEFQAYADNDVVFGSISATTTSVTVLTDAKLFVNADFTIRYRWQVLNICVTLDGKSSMPSTKNELVVVHQDNSEDRYRIGADGDVYIRDLWEQKRGLEERIVGAGVIEVKAGDTIHVHSYLNSDPVDAYISGGFTMQPVADDKMDVPVGGMFPIIHNMPDIKIIDFVKFLSAITGTFVRQGGDDDVVEFVSYNDMEDGVADAVDWSSRLIASSGRNIPRKVSFGMNGWARHNRFKWKEDERTLGFYDGDLYIDDDKMDEERDAMTFPFAASDGGVVPMYEQVAETEDGVTTYHDEYKAVQPRVLQYYDGNYAVAVFRLDMQRILDERYGMVVRSLNHAKVVEERLRMSDVEIQGFDETRPIWLAQYGKYFAVLELRSSGGGVATAKMIALDVEDRPIRFADAAVEALCVENWGANGVITRKQAAAVTSLNGVFRGRTDIKTFDELRFFTGLTGFTQGSNAQGEFYGCSALKSIKFPSLNITTADWRGLLRGCNELETVDLSPVKASRYYIYYFANLATTSKLTDITIPGGSYGGGSGGTTYARNAFNGCKQMTTLNIDGTADFSAISSFQTDTGAYLAFGNCTSLTTITGTITGIKADLNMAACPLTADSAMVILNGLADLTGQTGKTLTLSSTTKAALTAAGIDYNAIATAKNWQIS